MHSVCDALEASSEGELSLVQGRPDGRPEGRAARQQELCTPQVAAAAEQAGVHAELAPAAQACAGAAWPGFPHALLCLQEKISYLYVTRILQGKQASAAQV